VWLISGSPLTSSLYISFVPKKKKSHGRDNKLHVWRRPSSHDEPSTVGGGSASSPGTLELELGYSLDVNALNFCRFSLLPLYDDDDEDGHSAEAAQALVAVPNLVESSLASAEPFSFQSVVFETQLFLFFLLSRLTFGFCRLWRGYMPPSVKGV
jgi:hypothetical protein